MASPRSSARYRHRGCWALLRAENRAHHFGRPGEPSYRWAKRWVMEAFCPSDPAWREAVLPPALALIDRSIEKLRDTENAESFHE